MDFATLDVLPVQAWVAGLSNGELQSVHPNAAWAAFQGFTVGAVAPAEWRGNLHPDDIASTRANWARAIATGSAYSNVCRMKRASDGAYVWFRGDATPLRDAAGTVVAYAGVTTDIDDAMQAKARLAVEQQLLLATLDQLPVGAFILSAPFGTVPVLNRKMRELWGSTIDGVLESVRTATDFGPACVRYFHLDGRPFQRDDLVGVRAFLRGEVVTMEEYYLEIEGRARRRVCMSATPVYGADGAILAAVAICEDVTLIREQEAEQERLREEKRLAKAAAQAQSAFMANMNHELRTPVHGILGLSELLMQTLSNYDDESPTTASTAPASGIGLAPRSFTDITGIPDVSVAIDPPLPPPSGVIDRHGTVTLQRQYCAAIRECATLLESLVNSVLDFSKIDSGLMTLEAAPLDLRRVVDKSLTLLRTSALERGVALSADVAGDLAATLYGDPLRLQQIVINLVNNALKFSQGAEGGGRVHLRISRAPHQPLSGDATASAVAPLLPPPSAGGAAVGASPPPPVTMAASRVLIEVEDNGPGAPPGVAARLFRPFTQADSSTTRRYGGTGLGLSIVRGLAELMDGSASVASPNAMGGATFSCTVVLQQQQQQEEAAAAGGGGGDASPMQAGAAAAGTRVAQVPDSPARAPQRSASLLDTRILVVDDITINRLVAGRFLSALKAVVEFAEDGRAAVEAVARAQPPYDAVLMDCHMPVMDGFQASQAIRAMPDAVRSRVPIIAVSASALQEDVDRSLAAGMDAHVAKPIDSEALCACVLRWVHQHRTLRSATPPVPVDGDR